MANCEMMEPRTSRPQRGWRPFGHSRSRDFLGVLHAPIIPGLTITKSPVGCCSATLARKYAVTSFYGCRAVAPMFEQCIAQHSGEEGKVLNRIRAIRGRQTQSRPSSASGWRWKWDFPDPDRCIVPKWRFARRVSPPIRRIFHCCLPAALLATNSHFSRMISELSRSFNCM